MRTEMQLHALSDKHHTPRPPLLVLFELWHEIFNNQGFTSS